MPRKSGLPSTLKGLFRKELIEYCEECGSKNISVGTFRAEVRNQEDGMLIEYFCQRCEIRFEQFYNDRTLKLVAGFLSEKYDVEIDI